MTRDNVTHDERTITVENASYRWGYLILAYGTLASVAYRGLILHESSWELLGLVVGSGAVITLYQGRWKILSRQRAALTLMAVVLAALVALAIYFVRH